MVVFARILKQQRDTKLRQTKTGTAQQIRKQLISAIVLSLLFGLGWGFAFPATQGTNNAVAQYLFQAIFIALTAFQGLYIFIMHCIIGSKSVEVRQQWKRWLQRVSSRSSVFTSSYSKSTLERTTLPKGKKGTLDSSTPSDSTLLRTYATLPRETSSTMESAFNSSVVEPVTLEQTNASEPVDNSEKQSAAAYDGEKATSLLLEEKEQIVDGSNQLDDRKESVTAVSLSENEAAALLEEHPPLKMTSRKKPRVSFSDDVPVQPSEQRSKPSDRKGRLQKVKDAAGARVSIQVVNTYQDTVEELHAALGKRRESISPEEDEAEAEEQTEDELGSDANVIVNPAANYDSDDETDSAVFSPSVASTLSYQSVLEELSLVQGSKGKSNDCMESSVSFTNPLAALAELDASDFISSQQTPRESESIVDELERVQDSREESTTDPAQCKEGSLSFTKPTVAMEDELEVGDLVGTRQSPREADANLMSVDKSTDMAIIDTPAAALAESTNVTIETAEESAEGD